MAITSKTKSTTKAAAKAAPAVDKTAELEKQLASLVAKVADLEKQLAAVKAEAAKPAPAAAAPVSAGGRDEELRSELRRYFRTLADGKRKTQLPNL
tara:strand:- start:6898 stop:7185 length:288 start_codon:yes stop_codon:yes gene_type:complete